jgi:hypothetical protein
LTIQGLVLFYQIQKGAEFFFSEEDYLRAEESTPRENKISVKSKTRVKTEVKIELDDVGLSASTSGPSAARGRKRPRRSAASSIKSYAEPDSDDAMEGMEDEYQDLRTTKNKKVESNLQKWIKHLTILQKEEQKKVMCCMLQDYQRN